MFASINNEAKTLLQFLFPQSLLDSAMLNFNMKLIVNIFSKFQN